MRSLRTVFLLLLGFMASGWFAHAQSTEPASKNDGPTSVSASSASASRGASATEEEVNELRHEVAELRAQMRRLIEASAQTQSGAPHLALVNAVANPAPDLSPAAPATVAEVEALATEVSALQDKANTAPPITAGWNGEHFFLKSSDGNFTLMPVGYLDGQYTFYNGNGAPPDTFAITRARFGVQGNYGKQLDYTFLLETALITENRELRTDLIADLWPSFAPRRAEVRAVRRSLPA
jgi:HAMP domain-containing protein